MPTISEQMKAEDTVVIKNVFDKLDSDATAEEFVKALKETTTYQEKSEGSGKVEFVEIGIVYYNENNKEEN